jgi:cytochrome c peroxidase
MRTVFRLTGVAVGATLLVSFLLSNAEAERPDSREALVELGRRLFLDPAVSRAGRFSCASCHDPEHGFSDARRLSRDENGDTRRHSQPLLDLADGGGMHWDGEFDTVRELITARLAPFNEAREVARVARQRHFERATARGAEPDARQFRRKLATLAPPYYESATPNVPVRTPIEVRLERDGRYDAGFQRAFGTTRPNLERVIAALEAYVLSIRTTESRYDRYVAGDPSALDARERRGLRLFNGKANCATCHPAHAVDGARARFTDGKYHNTGVTFANIELELNGKLKGDGGFGEMNFVREDLGKFKTPSLRDVAQRAPYMHDGSFATLEDVVRYYDKGGTANRHLDANLQPLNLTDAEVDDLVAFLGTLSGGERAGLGPVPTHRPRRTTVKVVDVGGKPLSGLEVEVHPFGDRLADTRSPERNARTVTTDSTGRVRFAFPPWTHVVLKAKGFRLGGDRPLPDYTTRFKVTAVPADQVLVRVLGPKGRSRMPKRLTAWTGNQKVVAVFRRARQVRGNEAFYVCDVPDGAEVTRVRFDFPSKNRAMYEIDFTGGETGLLTLQ